MERHGQSSQSSAPAPTPHAAAGGGGERRRCLPPCESTRTPRDRGLCTSRRPRAVGPRGRRHGVTDGGGGNEERVCACAWLLACGGHAGGTRGALRGLCVRAQPIVVPDCACDACACRGRAAGGYHRPGSPPEAVFRARMRSGALGVGCADWRAAAPCDGPWS